MKTTSPEFKNSFKILQENIDDLTEWEKSFVESVSKQDVNRLSEKQVNKLMDIYKNYSKRR